MACFSDRRPDSQRECLPGIYVHVPFCSTICPYCDFAVAKGSLRSQERFVAGLLEEIGLWSAPGVVFDTVYFGGGTPSQLQVEQLARVAEALKKRFNVAADARFYLEANPEDAQAESLASWSEQGFQCLSLGVQALDDRSLRFLGRRHRSIQAREAICLAVDSSFEWVSVDLIYALPEQSETEWSETLAAVTELGPDHLSCYELTVHEGTPFAALEASGRLEATSQFRRADLFQLTHRLLGERGFEGYEVSSFGDPQRRSRHNQKYWTHVPYLGLGPSAHSFDGKRRWWNERDWKDYLSRLEQNRVPLAGREELSLDQLLTEAVFLGLRTTRGLQLGLLEEWLQVDLLESRSSEIEELQSRGQLILEGDFLRPTLRGLAVADQVARRLL